LIKNAANAAKVVTAAVAAMPDSRGCKCGSALKHALITNPDVVPAETRKKLELLVGKYLGS
jgi:5'-methylthioadenosine phosphorylase